MRTSRSEAMSIALTNPTDESLDTRVPNEQRITRAPFPRRRRRRMPRVGDRAFFGALTAAGLVTPAILVLFIAVLIYGAMPSIRAFGWSFLTSSVWEPNPDKEQYGA